MKQSLLLTIAIPTFNRAKSLSSQLTNIHNILHNNNISRFVEVLVSDNCSTDNTKKVVDSVEKLKKQQ